MGILGKPVFLASMIFVYDEVEYPCRHEFNQVLDSIEETISTIHYLFEEGNFSCDCNRSDFLSDEGYDLFDKTFECGNEIKMKNFSVKLKFKKGQIDDQR